MNDPVKLQLVSARMLTGSVRELVFAATGGAALSGYAPGAHFKFQLPVGERCYSLIDFESRASDAGHYRFAVLLEADGSGGSKHMHELKPGDEVEVLGPVNEFPLQPSKPALLIAGGIGVTPIISMATAHKAAGTAFRFHYACRTEAAMAYRAELEAAFGDQLTLHFDDRAEMALDLAGLMQSCGSEEHIYVCGPKGMIEAVKRAADAAGIADSRVHFELFTTAAAQAGDEAFEVEVKSTGEVFVVPAGKTIIDVLEEGGVDLVYDCQRGDCGICQTDVIDGVPDHRDVVLSDSEKAEGKVMQICVSRAKSARLVLDL